MLLLLALTLALTSVTCNASFVKVCATELANITCHNDSKIFIESVSYGRTDNVTCLAPNQAIPSCNASIDLSWRVWPYCQGKSSCVINGSYDDTVTPCDGNRTNYLNISYNCKIINETEFPENTLASFVCPVGEVFVIHRAEWRGIEYILKNRTISPSTNEFPTASTNNLAYQTNIGIFATHVSETSNTVMLTEVTTPNQLPTSVIQASSTQFVAESFTTSPDTLLTTTLNSSPKLSQVVILSSSAVSASPSLGEVAPRSSSSSSLVASPVSPSASPAQPSESLSESSKTLTTLLVPTPASLATSTVSESASSAPSPALGSASLAVAFSASSESLAMASKSLLLSPSPASMTVLVVTVCPKSSFESSTVTASPASLWPALSSLPPQSSLPLTLLPQNEKTSSSITTSSSFYPKIVSSSVSQSSLDSSNSSMFKQSDCVIYEYYNITKVLKPKGISPFKLGQCRGKRRCNLNVTRTKLGEPYKNKITSLRLFIKNSCQPASSGYLQWQSWSACPDVCGIRYHQVRRRICLNPTRKTGGADCSGLRSETNPAGCYTPCLDRNSTTCDFMTANLTCPNGTFININTVFYGHDVEVNMTCNVTGATNGSCLPSADMEGHNSAQVYERCQMRKNCTFMVSNGTFRDPCPGVTKHLKIKYSCSPVFKRTFCDEDKALISCPPELRLVFHNEPFYGQVNSSDSCPATGPTCISDLTYDDIDQFCGDYSCDISGVSGSKLGLTGQLQCKDTSNYLTVYHSCQQKNAVYTAWGSWEPCETCGLTNRRKRSRECVAPGISYSAMGACAWSYKNELEHCYRRCGDLHISLYDGENTTIVCPMSGLYEKYPTVIEIRSVFYGNGSCSSNNTSKIAVMKRCQGRQQCYLEASADIFNDSCPEIKKHLNVTYRCQPIYHMSKREGYTLIPRDLHCYDDMVIVTHAVSWQSEGECAGNSKAMKIIQSLCDGRNSCHIVHSKSVLGGSCSSDFEFKMYYSCQTAYGGLDTEWSSWSNCTECGHTPVKTRVKTCLSPVSKTSGAHCPLIQQIAPCNYPCPVSGLSFVSNSFSVVLGQNFSVLWKLSLGTNSTVVINWGDDSGNETVSRNILANATTPFFLTNEHNYTSEGDYVVKLYAFNFFSNQTIWKMAHIQVKLSGLNFTAPSAVATNTSSRFKISLHVVSLSAPNISFLFGDGLVFNSISLETNYSYPQAGLYIAKVIVANKVSTLTSTRPVIVQDLVEGFRVDRDVYLVAVGERARFIISIARGTNVSVNATYDDCKLPFLTTWLSGPSNLDSLLTCVFDTVGVCNGLFYASNAVSQANASALIISEIAIHGFNVTLQCLSEYPSCFQQDRIVFHLNLTNGTLPKFVFNMGDGHTILSTDSILNYSFSSNGSFDVNITAYNNVSSKSILRRVAILRLVPLVGVDVTCNKTVGLSETTVCYLTVHQGTAFQCWLNLGDREHSKVFFMYTNQTSFWNYNYTWYGTYTVTFACNNTISSSTAVFTTKVVPRTLEMSINHNGPVMVKNVVTLNLTASETGYPSCFTLDLGNSHKVVFGPLSCTPNDSGYYIENSSFIFPFMLYHYRYSTAGVYNLTWSGQNGFECVSVNTTVIVTELPCLAPDVTLPNIGSSPLTPTGMTRSKEVTIRSRYHIDCERATGAILLWEIFKNETENRFVLQNTKVTETSHLILLSNELEYGLYRIKLTLTLVNAFSIEGVAEGYVKVTTSDLIIDMQEGSANERMYSRPLVINATGSRDPDTSDGSGLEFKWYCYNITDRSTDFITSKTPLSSLLDILVENPLQDGCFNDNGTLPMNSSYIYLPREKIIKNGIYVIKLVLVSGKREATKSTVIKMKDEEISHFHIRCKVNCKHMVVTTDILSVTSRCVSRECLKTNSSSSFSWELFHRGVNETGLLNWTKVNDLENIALSNTSSKNLVLKAKVLKPEMSYVIRLRYRSFAYEGLTEYSFTTSRPPHGGNCSVGPSEGKAYETMFTFACSGWKTKHLPLLYVFSYYDPYTQLKPLLFRAEEEQFSVKLAPGKPTDNFQLTVFFSIIDSLGGRIADQRSLKVLPRNFVQSELDDLVLNYNSKLDFYINIGDIDSVSELVSGVLSNLNYVAAHGNDSSVNELQKKVKVRYTVMEKISRIPISTLTDVNQVSTMIAAAAEVKEQVNSTAQQIATDKISSMITLLVNKSQDDIGVSVVTEGAENLVSAVFNILMSASYNADFRRKDGRNDADQEKSKEIAYRNMNNFDRVAEAIFNKQLPGQNDTEIQTKSAILTCRRTRGTDIVEHPIKAGNASVKFPNIADLLGKRVVDVQLLYIPRNPFTWDKSSELVTTTILDVKVKESQGARQIINISNLAEEIDLEIPFEPLTPLSAPEVFFKQADNESIQYHISEVDETNGAMEFYVKSLEKQEQMTILVKYEAKPTISEYDLQVKLPNFSSCSFVHDNCTENPYTIFLPSTYLNKKGTYYIGVKYDGTPGSQPDVHSRERRDCMEGGRIKRSLNCIEYKDPPPAQPSNGKFASNQQGYDKSKHSNYTMESLGLGCNYWNPSSNQFSGGGCRTGRRRTLSRTLSCRCKHLTSFGGGLLVKPNPIDFDKVWIAFDDIHNNMAVLATMISILLLYLLVIIWARRADIKDRDSQKGIVVVGKPWNHNAYEVTICTSKGRNSGTTARIAFIIVGENGSSGVIPLSKLTKVKFGRGSVVTCTLYLPSSLGQLLYLHIWHDNAGDDPSWNLDHVVVRDTMSDEKWNFMCGEWLAVESDDGQTEKVIYVANIGEMANYKHLFLSNSANGLYDEHLWISVAAKPPTSSFTRVQRASCCLSILFSTMIANAMFYDSGKADTSPVFYLGPIKISMRQLMIGIQSSLIIFPINLGMTQLFRKSSTTTIPVNEEKAKTSLPKSELTMFNRRFGRRPSSFKYLPLQYQLHITSSMSTIISGSESTFNFKTDDSIITKEKRKRYFSRFLYYLAWILCFVSVFVSAFFTLMYSLEWGSERSEQWLLSFFVSFIQDAAISQPVKVALFSALLAFLVKFSMEQREKHRRSKTRKMKTNDDDDDNGSAYSTEVQLGDEVAGDDSLPLQKNVLQKAKMKRMKEIKSSEVMTDVLFYSVFLLLLLIMAYGHRDPIAYEMTNHLESIFHVSAQHFSGILSWVLSGIIPAVFVGPWYNGMPAADSENGLLNDRNSALVGMARLRQLRVLNDTCSNIPVIRYLARGCYGLYSSSDEDTSLYKPEWVPVPPNIPIGNISYDMCPRPWRYHTATELKGVPLWGTTNVYSGGGYVAELDYYPAKSLEVIKELAHHKWIDRRTRGVFVEFTVYNAQVNLFSVISLLVEAMPTGGVETFRRIDTIRVYRYVGELANVTLAAELIIVLVILFLLYKVIKRMYHQRLAFFRKFWNLVDLMQVLFALVSIALYFVKMISINATMKDLSDNPFLFVSFSMLLTWNEIDTYMIAFVVFLTTIKFLYLLRYNNHIKLLNQTFSNMRKEMLLFMVQFLFWFLPFVIMSHISFGTHLQDFVSLPSAFQAMLNALLGASYFHDLEQVDRVIGPALFFCYSILMELILLNMFVSIINAAFGDREAHLEPSETDPELIEFIMKRLKAILGVNLLSSSVGPEQKWFVDDSSDDENGYRIMNTKYRYNVLNRKLAILQSKFRDVSILEEEEEDEDALLEMMLIKHEQESLASSRSECSGTTETSF